VTGPIQDSTDPMQRDALEALIATYRAHAEPRLLSLILEAGEPDSVLPLINGLDVSAYADAPARRKGGSLALAGRQLDLARTLAEAGREPEDQILLARVAHAQGDLVIARVAYQRAIAANPTLEDVELAAILDQPGDGQEKVTNVVSFAGRHSERTGGAGGRDNNRGDGPSELAPTPFEPSRRITFADVGGLEDAKAQIRRRIITPFLKPSLFEKFRRKAGGGVMLYGPPGCGKTLLARATAGECRAKFFAVHIAEILDMYVGQSEKRLAAAFAEARRETPTVLFFDEIEALAARRHYGSNDATASLVSTFLSELDGFQQNNEGVLILAATNVPWAVDAAFRRPGRFDRIQFVPPPDRVARREIMAALIDGIPGATTVNVDRLAEKTSGFSGADLKNLIETATDLAIETSLADQAAGALSDALLEKALSEVKPTTLEWLTTARNYAKYSNTAGQYDDVLAFLDKHGR
jgi:transitional endoplasmic reticulum ATPase